MSRKKIACFECGHEGCKELGRYTYANAREYDRLCQDYGNGKWRCVRHSNKKVVLSTDNMCIVKDYTAGKVVASSGANLDGLFWTELSSGFIFGPEFCAFARDFPEGTILRITAEVILPNDGTAVCPACKRPRDEVEFGWTCVRGGCPLGGDF